MMELASTPQLFVRERLKDAENEIRLFRIEDIDDDGRICCQL